MNWLSARLLRLCSRAKKVAFARLPLHFAPASAPPCNLESCLSASRLASHRVHPPSRSRGNCTSPHSCLLTAICTGAAPCMSGGDKEGYLVPAYSSRQPPLSRPRSRARPPAPASEPSNYTSSCTPPTPSKRCCLASESPCDPASHPTQHLQPTPPSSPSPSPRSKASLWRPRRAAFLVKIYLAEYLPVSLSPPLLPVLNPAPSPTRPAARLLPSPRLPGFID